MRKAIWLASLLITLIFISIYFYFGKGLTVKSSTEAFKYIDQNNALIFEFQYDENLSELITEAEAYSYVFPDELKAEIFALDSIIKSNERLIDMLSSKDIFAGIQKVNSSNISGIYVVNLSDTKPDLESIFSNQNKSIERAESRMFEAIEIYTANINEDKAIYYTYDAPFLILSFQSNIIENAIRSNHKSTSLYYDQKFKNHIEAQQHEVKLARVYLNYTSSTDLLSIKLLESELNRFNVIKNLGQYSVFELNYKKDAWVLNGEMITVDDDYFNVFKGQTENVSYLNQFLSSNTFMYKNVVLSNQEIFRAKLSEYYRKNNSFLYEAELKIFKKRYGISFSQWASQHLGDEYILSKLISSNFNSKTGNIAMLVLKNKELKNNLSLTKEFKKITTHKDINIYSFPVKNIMYLLLGDLAKNKNYQYCITIDDVMILSSDVSDLKKYIDDYINMDFLVKKNSYQKILESLNESFNFYYYNSIAGSEETISQLLNIEGRDELKSENSISKYNGFTYSISNVEDVLINNVYIPLSIKDNSQNLKELWSVSLSTPTSNQPTWLSLGVDQKNYLFIQDESLKLYKIGENSNVEWKVGLNEKVISAYYKVDYYNNSQNQILFNSENFIYLLKEDGTFMPGYPKKLPHATQLSLSLFDYDNDKNYRVFIATKNASIYAYDLSGRPLEGWNPKKIIESYEPIIHKRIQGKDVLFVRGLKDFYLLDRKGNVINLYKDSSHITYNNPFYFRADANYAMNRFVSTDQNGKIKSILLDGRKLFKSVGTWSTEHHFLHADVAADTSYEYVFIDNNQLFMYSDDSTLGYNFQFNSKISEAPFALKLGAKNLLGVHSSEESLLYVFDRNAEILKGFPISSVTKPAILNEKSKQLITTVTKEGKVITYLTEF